MHCEQAGRDYSQPITYPHIFYFLSSPCQPIQGHIQTYFEINLSQFEIWDENLDQIRDLQDLRTNKLYLYLYIMPQETINQGYQTRYLKIRNLFGKFYRILSNDRLLEAK